MAMFELQTPDGATYEVEAPDEQSAIDALGQMQGGTPQPEQPAAQQPLSWSDVPGQALQNAPSSALEFGKALVQPVLHPLDTANNLNALGRGALMRVPGMQALDEWGAKNLGLESSYGTPEAQQQYELAGNVGQFFKDRYGSEEGLKRTLAQDPVGAAADVSTVLTGGGGLLARVPGTAARVTSKALTTAGRVTNPVTAVAAPTGLLTRKPAAALLGMTTGAGGDSVREAFRAGERGGSYGKTFRDNMRGNEAQESVLTEAKAALGKMASERSDAYRKGMVATKANKTMLDKQPIEDAMQDLTDSMFHGPSPVTNKASIKLLKEVGQTIDDWWLNHPNMTPEDLDRLKVKLDKMKPNWTKESGDQARIIATMRTAVRDEILRKDPTYAKTMKDYENSISAQQEIERALSLGKRSSKDTALRKMQSIMRNNVNTNYGSRKNQAKKLELYGADTLMPKLAGQSLSALTPRGLASLGATGLLGAAAYALDPTFVGGLLATSPRIVGETSHLLGRMKRTGRQAPLILYQAGRDATGQ